VHDAIGVLGTLDRDAVVESKGRSRRARADRSFRPVGTFDEQHALGFASQRPIPIDPEQTTRFVSDSDDQAGIAGMTDEQAVDGWERQRHRVGTSVMVKIVFIKIDHGVEVVGIELELQ